MIAARHAFSMGSDGSVVCADSLVSDVDRDAQGVYFARFVERLPLTAFAAAMMTRRGTDLRYFAAINYVTDYLWRITVRDTSLSLIDSALDVLLFARGAANPDIERLTHGAVTGSNGASLITGPGVTPSRTTTGDYSLELAPAYSVAAASCLGIHVGRIGQGARYSPSVEHTDADTKRVTIRGAGAPLIDADFSYSIWKLAT